MATRKVLYSVLAGCGLLLTANGAGAETLKEAVDTAIATHPEVRSVAHNRLARDEEVDQAWSGYLPKVDFIAGYGIQEKQEPIDETLYPKIYTLSLRQNVFTGLATMNEVKRQEARVQSAAYRLQGTSEHVALRTSEVYLNVLRTEDLNRLAEENLQSHLRISDQIKLRSDSGVSSQADNEQVSSRVDLARANVVATKTNLADAKSNYLSVVGKLPENLEKPGSFNDLVPATMEEAEVMAVDNHPTLKSANADLEARNKQHDVAAAPYWPVVDIEVDQNWEEDLDNEGREDDLVAMVKLRYNLFKGLYDFNRREETAQQISEAREIRNSTQRQVVESIRLSYMAYQAVQERLDFLRDRVASTQATADAYSKQFNLGKRTLLDVLDTEAEVIDARRALVDAEYDLLFSQFRILNGTGSLVKAFGLMWPEESVVEEEEKEEGQQG